MLILPPPPFYVPLKQAYEVAPGLFPFGTDFGQGEQDRRIFQFDSDFAVFRDNKAKCRQENLSKYYPPTTLSSAAARAATEFLISRFTQEWPQFFQFDGSRLNCVLSGETLTFDGELRLTGPSLYKDAIDALVSQAQEDLAIVSESGGRDELSLLHVCSPSHWAPGDKAGLDFKAVHAPIPGVEKMNRAASALVSAMIHKGPFVRFVWSFVTDQRLNHHPSAPPGFDKAEWKGRAFAAEKDVPFYLRVERQITWGLPTVNAALFFIRVSFVSGEKIRSMPEYRANLLSSLRSMTPESRGYKGVADCFDELVAWLDAR